MKLSVENDAAFSEADFDGQNLATTESAKRKTEGECYHRSYEATKQSGRLASIQS
jgi:hypothetical protein